MKYFIAIILFCMMGCESKQNPGLVLAEVNSKLSNMYQEVASCDELARCMGYSRGDVIGILDHLRNLYSDGKSQTVIVDSPFKFICVLNGNPELVELEKIQPMLRGCKFKKCPERECK